MVPSGLLALGFSCRDGEYVTSLPHTMIHVVVLHHALVFRPFCLTLKSLLFVGPGDWPQQLWLDQGHDVRV